MNVKGVHCTKYFYNASKSVYRFSTKSVPTKWNVSINKKHECKVCTLYSVHCTKYFHKASESVKNRKICKTCHTFSGVVRVGTSPFLSPPMNFCPPHPSTTNWYPDKMPQSQKRTKCHNVNGEIRMQQKCYKDVTKVLQGCNMV